MSGADGELVTPRLRLVPIGPSNAADLWLVHDDEAVAPWYDGWRPWLPEAHALAERIAESWRLHGVHKWIAYDRDERRRRRPRRALTDARRRRLGPALRLPARRALGPCGARGRQAVPGARALAGDRLGAAARVWGHGYASEIGRAGLDLAFDVLGARAVVSCTARHNLRSRAVMERIGLRRAGEIVGRGTVEGEGRVRDDAPFTAHVLLRQPRAARTVSESM